MDKTQKGYNKTSQNILVIAFYLNEVLVKQLTVFKRHNKLLRVISTNQKGKREPITTCRMMEESFDTFFGGWG